MDLDDYELQETVTEVRVRKLTTLEKEMVRLLDQIADHEQCTYDHHGGCQTYGYLDPDDGCAVAEAQAVLQLLGIRDL